jgi:hypothetical protein
MIRDEFYHPAHSDKSHENEENSCHHGRHGKTAVAVFLNNGEDHNDKGTGGPADLYPAAS